MRMNLAIRAACISSENCISENLANLLACISANRIIENLVNLLVCNSADNFTIENLVIREVSTSIEPTKADADTDPRRSAIILMNQFRLLVPCCYSDITKGLDQVIV